jgi:hypothetical protein
MACRLEFELQDVAATAEASGRVAGSPGALIVDEHQPVGIEIQLPVEEPPERAITF